MLRAQPLAETPCHLVASEERMACPAGLSPSLALPRATVHPPGRALGGARDGRALGGGGQGATPAPVRLGARSVFADGVPLTSPGVWGPVRVPPVPAGTGTGTPAAGPAEAARESEVLSREVRGLWEPSAQASGRPWAPASTSGPPSGVGSTPTAAKYHLRRSSDTTSRPLWASGNLLLGFFLP